MSKPFSDDDADLPPEPTPLDDDLPPMPAEPSLRSRSSSRPSGMAAPASTPVPLAADDASAQAPPSLAKELLGSAEQSAGPSLAADGDVLSVGGARYRITQRLGAGGMGEVFLARKLGAGGFERDVALKTVLPRLANHRDAASHLRTFTDEARLAALLHHPGICQVHDLQPIPGRGLLQVLEYIPGHSLKTVLETARAKRASLTEPFACFVARELAAALDYAHHATDTNGRPLNIVHRDVTPHNVMISATGNVKLLDFGIAFSALENREATTSQMMKGKTQYSAPEQVMGGALDARTDQFALGLCLYEMLVLKRLITAAKTDTETAIQMRIAQLTPETVEGILKTASIDDSLKAILLHALAPAPDERFPSCAELGDALQAFSQRRGWLYTAADARKELDALFALPDSPDAEKTNPSGRRVYGVAPRHVPKQTVPLPQLTPGRSFVTPPAQPAELSQSLPIELEPEPAEALAPEASVSLKPSLTAQKRRAQVQEALHNPKTSARKMLALPLAVLAGTLVVGIVLVKMLVLSSPSGGSAPAVEVVKTPEQLRAEREAEARATTPAALPPPELAPAPAPVAAAEPPAQPTAAPSKPARSTHRSKDAKAVDDLLAKQYGRPVVTPEAPQGATAPSGTPRRSLDTVMIADSPAAAAPGTGPLSLPRGTVLPARLTAPADTGQASPVTAAITADVKVAGVVAVPKGATLICTSSPGARLALACDTLTIGRAQHAIDGVAFGADKRVGLPLPRTATPSPAGDAAKDNAVALGRTLLGRVTPEGPAGDVVNAAGNTASTAAGSGASAPAAAPLLPAGTAFTVFLQSSTQ